MSRMYWILISMLMPCMGGIINTHIYHKNFTLIFWFDLILFIASAVLLGIRLDKLEKEKR